MTNCKKCSEKLLFGKGIQRIPWCPQCEGIKIVPSEEVLKILRTEIKETNKKIEAVIVNFNKESLLISLYITREGQMHSDLLNQHYFMSITELMKKIIEMDFNGSVKCDPMSDEFQKLLRYSESFNRSKITLRLFINGWGKFINLRNRQLREYCFDFDKVLKADGISKNFDNDDLASTWKFTYEWHSILSNFEENGLYPKTVTVEKVTEIYPEKLRLNEFWRAIRVKMLLELSSGDNQVLEIESLNNVRGGDLISYLRILDEINVNFPFEIDILNENGDKRFKARPVDLVSFLLPFAKSGLPLEKFREFFFSVPFEYKCLGAFLVTSKGLFVGRQTLRVVSAFLKAKYYRDYLIGNHAVGQEFEDLVAEELGKVGIKFSDPTDPAKVLRNIKDDENNPTLEIDILASSKDKLFVIDCKSMVISSDFISNTREGFVKITLKDEIEKQERRIEFVRNNMEKFGFDSSQYKVIENVIVTYNKEPLSKLENINIVCVRDLGSLIS